MRSSESPVAGLMQDWPLTVNRFLDHARSFHGHREIVWRRDDGMIARKTYAEAHQSARQLSCALRSYGIGLGDRVATLAMNGVEHFEAWYAIAGIGGICHTLNPRMTPGQLAYIVQDAADRIIFADAAYMPVLAEILPVCPSVEKIVCFSAAPQPGSAVTLAEFVAGHPSDCEWGGFDEHAAAGLCYTSGTTGQPKGVVYSHRSNFLHTLITLQHDVLALGVRDTVMPVVPMYHANAWGLVFSAPATGARLVLPGAKLDGASLFALIESEGVTFAAGVPTVWLSLLEYLRKTGLRPASLKRVLVGGAACPERVIREFCDLGVEATHAWGMTEMSPVGGVGTLTPEVAKLPFDQQMPWRIKQGRSPCGVELKIVDAEGTAMPHDGKTMGNLKVRGPAIAGAYYKDSRPLLDDCGFFNTGDIATIDEQGFLQITDRAKDIIKSGGEWISSLELENAALLHPGIANAAVIAMPHAQWGERPLLLLVAKAGVVVEPAEMLAFLGWKLAKWHMPDKIVLVEEFPLGPTGKVDKRALRQIHGEKL